MNMDTFAGFIGGTGVNQIASQTLASTTETEFKYNTGATPTTAIAILKVPLATDIVGTRAPFDPALNPASTVRMGNRNLSQYFNSNHIDNGVPFLVRICGLATPASNAGNTLTIILYNGDDKGDTAIATTGAVPQATTTTAKAFIVEAELVWNSTSQTIVGQYWFQMAGSSGTTYTTWATLTAPGTSVTAAALHFCASATWGDAVGGVVAVSEFSASRF